MLESAHDRFKAFVNHSTDGAFGRCFMHPPSTRLAFLENHCKRVICTDEDHHYVGTTYHHIRDTLKCVVRKVTAHAPVLETEALVLRAVPKLVDPTEGLPLTGVERIREPTAGNL